MKQMTYNEWEEGGATSTEQTKRHIRIHIGTHHSTTETQKIIAKNTPSTARRDSYQRGEGVRGRGGAGELDWCNFTKRRESSPNNVHTMKQYAHAQENTDEDSREEEIRQWRK